MLDELIIRKYAIVLVRMSNFTKSNARPVNVLHWPIIYSSVESYEFISDVLVVIFILCFNKIMVIEK